MLYFNNLEIARGGAVLLKDASAVVYPRAKVGLVGKNGCGKSSLFAAIKGELAPEAGEIVVPDGWVVASVSQETPALAEGAADYVMDGDAKFRRLQAAARAAEERGDGMAAAAAHAELEAAGGYAVRNRAEALLTGLGFAREDYDAPVKNFSGGWRMRLNLARALLCPSDLLLLDEPTNHLDLDTVIWLEDWLRGYPGTLIIVSHDRDFLDNICTRVIHIENLKLRMYAGNFSAFEEERSRRIALQEALYEKQQAKLARLRSFVDRFRYKATKARQAQSRLKAMEKMERIVLARYDSPFSFEFGDCGEMPRALVRLEDLTAGYPDKTVLTGVELTLSPGSRIGLLGRNGAGKSTLIKTLAGVIPPLGGVLNAAKGVRIGYFAQHRVESLDGGASPLAHLARLAPDAREQDLRSFLGGFGFGGDKALEETGHFSGGEKARLALALIVWQRPNLLLLDEPTNHLDLDMREALILALAGFRGALIAVSHDRHLLKTTTDEFYLVSEGRVAPFAGDLGDYRAYLAGLDKKKTAERARPAAPEPGPERNAAFKSKERKKIEAGFRESLRPLKQEIENLDRRIAELSDLKARLEARLADEKLYDPGRREELREVLLRRSRTESELGEAETLWMEKSEILERRTREFGAASGREEPHA